MRAICCAVIWQVCPFAGSVHDLHHDGGLLFFPLKSAHAVQTYPGCSATVSCGLIGPVCLCGVLVYCVAAASER
jgi:hypothetical protein